MAARGLAPSEVSEADAIQAARAVLEGNVELSPGGGVEVARRGTVFVGTFTHSDPAGPGAGPGHDAEVEVEAHTGRVTELRVGA